MLLCTRWFFSLDTSRESWCPLLMLHLHLILSECSYIGCFPFSFSACLIQPSTSLSLTDFHIPAPPPPPSLSEAPCACLKSARCSFSLSLAHLRAGAHYPPSPTSHPTWPFLFYLILSRWGRARLLPLLLPQLSFRSSILLTQEVTRAYRFCLCEVSAT